MRTLPRIFYLFSGSSSKTAGDDLKMVRIARTEKYRAMLSAMSAGPAASTVSHAHDLPDDIRAIIEARIED